MFNLGRLLKPQLFYEFAPSKNFRCKIIEQPGLWMPDHDWKMALEEIRSIAGKSGSLQELDYGILKGEKLYCDNTVVTVVYDAKTRAPVAFNAMSYMDVDIAGNREKIVHLGLVMVDPECRGRGMTWILYGLTCMLLFFRKLLNPIWITNVTQVPAVFGSVSENYDNVFPNPRRNVRRSFKHMHIAEQVMMNYRHIFGVGNDAIFDRERFVIMNSYTGGSDGLKKTFDEASKHRIQFYNEVCQRELDYDRGDDFFQIGQINMTVIKNYLLHDVPRGSLLSVAYHAVFLLFSAVLLPLLRWFITTQPMGELRPWKAR